MEMAQEIVSKGFNPRSPCGERRFDSREKWSRAMFQPTLPLRGATGYHWTQDEGNSWFQPTLPLRGATPSKSRPSWSHGSFNPRSPCGERRLWGTGRRPVPIGFNPRSPCGERRRMAPIFEPRRRSFNPRSPCGERLGYNVTPRVSGNVSTHAPLAGSDDVLAEHPAHGPVSTHAPLAGSDI